MIRKSLKDSVSVPSALHAVFFLGKPMQRAEVCYGFDGNIALPKTAFRANDKTDTRIEYASTRNVLPKRIR